MALSLGRGALVVVRGGDRKRTLIRQLGQPLSVSVARALSSATSLPTTAATSTTGPSASAPRHHGQQQQHALSTAAAALRQPMAGHAVDTQSELHRMNEEVRPLESDPLSVLKWAMAEFDGRVAMSTSFGIQAAVLLHLATQVKPDIPVVWVDTGYLPAETYRYADELTQALNLNLRIASNPQWTPARMEALHGKLWEAEDAESHGLYGRLRKVDPLKQGLDALDPNPLVLLSGLRAAQTTARANMPPVGFQQGRFKLLPLLRMSDDDVAAYMDRHDLPQHPLQAKGYVTVGDWHSSRPVEAGEDPRNTRFGGKFQECGLHVDSHEPVAPAAAAAAAAAPSKPAQHTQTQAQHTQAQAQQVQQQPQVLLPESLEKTGVRALALTRAHPETQQAVIIVKKLTEDRSFCRKCNDVADKIASDNLTDWIGHTAVADVLDPTSEGAVLARHFGVATAPFFLVRDAAAEQAQSEWTVVRSYLQLRKLLERAAEHVHATQEANADPVRHDAKEHDPELLRARQALEELKVRMAAVQLELREQQQALQQAEQAVHARAEKLGLE